MSHPNVIMSLKRSNDESRDDDISRICDFGQTHRDEHPRMVHENHLEQSRCARSQTTIEHHGEESNRMNCREDCQITYTRQITKTVERLFTPMPVKIRESVSYSTPSMWSDSSTEMNSVNSSRSPVTPVLLHSETQWCKTPQAKVPETPELYSDVKTWPVTPADYAGTKLFFKVETTYAIDNKGFTPNELLKLSHKVETPPTFPPVGFEAGHSGQMVPVISSLSSLSSHHGQKTDHILNPDTIWEEPFSANVLEREKLLPDHSPLVTEPAVLNFRSTPYCHRVSNTGNNLNLDMVGKEDTFSDALFEKEGMIPNHCAAKALPHSDSACHRVSNTEDSLAPDIAWKELFPDIIFEEEDESHNHDALALDKAYDNLSSPHEGQTSVQIDFKKTPKRKSSEKEEALPSGAAIMREEDRNPAPSSELEMERVSKTQPTKRASSVWRWTTEEDETLRYAVDQLQEALDWQVVSTVYFEGRRTKRQCKCRWKRLEDSGQVLSLSRKEGDIKVERKVETPQKRRSSLLGRWTAEEDKTLRLAVEQQGESPDWSMISSDYFQGMRSDLQCKSRWRKFLAPGLFRGNWTEEEDEIIRKCIQDGVKKWSTIADRLDGRIGEYVKDRWLNHLDPTLKKTPWTNDELILLHERQKMFGNQWSKIAKYIPGRSELIVKNKWYNNLDTSGNFIPLKKVTSPNNKRMKIEED